MLTNWQHNNEEADLKIWRDDLYLHEVIFNAYKAGFAMFDIAHSAVWHDYPDPISPRDSDERTFVAILQDVWETETEGSASEMMLLALDDAEFGIAKDRRPGLVEFARKEMN